jgi:thioredoxin reductase
MVKDGKLVVDEYEQTNVANVFCIGDCAQGEVAVGIAARCYYIGVSDDELVLLIYRPP